MVKAYEEQLHLGESRLNELYMAYNLQGKSELKSPAAVVKVLREAGLLQRVVSSWNNRPMQDVAELCANEELVVAVVKDIFDVLDQDHSGAVSFSELLTGIAVILEGSNTEKMFRFRFKATDVNNDGQLSFEEATRLSGLILNVVSAALQTALKQTTQKLKECGATDKDLRDLSAAFQRILKESNLAQKETEILFQFADKDQNGTISEDEYVAFMLDKDAQARREQAFGKVVGPSCYLLGQALGLELVELGNRIKARYGR